eukprot:c9789_g1_i1 orf=92-1126(+)
MEAAAQGLFFTKITAGLCTSNRSAGGEAKAEKRTCLQGVQGRRVCMQGLQGKTVCMQGLQERTVGAQIDRRACMQSLHPRRVCLQGLQRRRVFMPERGRPHGLLIRMGMHPEWRQVDNKIRRLEHRIADFRIMSNDLRIQRTKIGSDDPEINQVKLMEHIKKREIEVVAEREALQKEMEHLTVYFHKGAEPEYKGLRRFFLSYLYHTSRKAFENFPIDEFDRVLIESPGGISYELPERGTVTFAPHLCKKIIIGKKISVSATGLDTSPLAIALAILQAGAQRHCDDPSCRREECVILKEDYEQLFEAFFKRKIRPLINQKSRGEMSVQYDAILKIERITGVKAG